MSCLPVWLLPCLITCTASRSHIGRSVGGGICLDEVLVDLHTYTGLVQRQYTTIFINLIRRFNQLISQEISLGGLRFKVPSIVNCRQKVNSHRHADTRHCAMRLEDRKSTSLNSSH